MRQRHKKGLTNSVLLENKIITDAVNIGVLDKCILEVGAGKGLFITSLAKAFQDILFIALERNESVVLEIAKKRDLLDLNNLVIICGDVANISEYSLNGKVMQIYLNFPDPWPKKRHHKRRLSYPNFLDIYFKLLTKGGKLTLKTDHKEFFLDSIQYIKEKFLIKETTDNLKASNFQSEYEIKKRLNGPIYMLEGEKNG